jgi:hypothetical protein
MSRSALWRQEGAKKQREKEAEELFELAIEEGRVRIIQYMTVGDICTLNVQC